MKKKEFKKLCNSFRKAFTEKAILDAPMSTRSKEILYKHFNIKDK